MEPTFDIKKRFPVEDQPIAGHLGKFIILFVQALLKIGHFQSNDAKGLLAKQELFQEWGHLASRGREVSFVIQVHEGTSVVFVYGILSEIVPIEKLFSPDMAQLFTAKIFDYFNRVYLAGFTLKPGITIEELDMFIEIMRMPINVADMDNEIQAITEKLLTQKIVHASVVYRKELFVSKEPLHFISRMALTRFEKELRILPLYSHLTHTDKIDYKKRLFKDILVPLSDTTILKEILLHGHAMNNAGWEMPIDIEVAMGQEIGCDLLWKFLLEFTDTLGKNPRAEENDRLVSIIQKIVLHLSLDRLKDESEDVLEMLLQENVITLLEIPDLVLDRVHLKRKADDYLKNKANYWETLQSQGQGKTFIELSFILPLLLKRNEFLSFGELLDKMRQASKDYKAQGESYFLEKIGMTSMQETILLKIADRHIPNRKELFLILESLSVFLCKSLLPFCADEDILLRKNICKVLATTGEKCIPDIIAYANDSTHNWYFVRNVVMILGDIGSSNGLVLVFLKHCQRHPNLRVREEVITSYSKMRGSEIEKLLLKELGNPDIASRSRVIAALGNFHPMNEKVKAFIEEAIKKKKKSETPVDDPIQIACCLAIETIARLAIGEAQYFEPILCHALTPDKPNMFGLIKDKSHEKVYEVKRAICRVLGEIGTKSAFPLVGRLITEKYWRPEDRALMQQILQKIERRVGVGE
jgi:hypothetical protein